MKLAIALMVLTVSLGCGQSKELQGTANEAEIESLLDNKNYQFRVRTVLPSRGRVIQANGVYDVQVRGDSLVSYLPYFGRAYSAPIGSTQGGLQFTSTDFSYSKEARRKGGWLIKIHPNDNRDIQQMFLTVTESGSATLQVTSTNRQPISYHGYVMKKE